MKEARNQRFLAYSNRRNHLNKRGQFYLLAAIVIIGVIIGFVAILNYAKRTPSIRLYDLAEELEIESEAVLDYVKMNEDDKVENFTRVFDVYVGGGPEIYFVNNTNAYRYYEGNLEFEDFQIKEGKIIVKINENEYEFEAKPGENFYFVMLQRIEGEEYVVTN